MEYLKSYHISIKASKKPRRSVIRSLSWKRASKKTKMDDELGHFSDTSIKAGAKVCATSSEDFALGRSFNTTTSTMQGMSDEDAEDAVYDNSRASTSKKRKKAGVWKTVRRFFHRKSSKKSPPQRSMSDPNLTHTPVDRPDVAPFEQIIEAPLENEVPITKKALSVSSFNFDIKSCIMPSSKSADVVCMYGFKHTNPLLFLNSKLY